LPLFEPEDREALGCAAAIAALLVIAAVLAIVVSFTLSR